MKTTTRVMLAAVLGALLLVSTGCTTKVVTTGQGGAGANTVTASGNGRTAAVPDEATMTFGVVRTAKDAKKALDEASKAAAAIGDELNEQGVQDEDIQTSGVNVYPRYREADGRSVIDGFEASVQVTAKVRDLGTLGSVITALAGAGADTVSGPVFGISEDTEARAQAIEKAVDDARRQATEMAKAAGRNVGDVVSITSSAVNVPVPMYSARAEAMDAAGAVPVEPGTLDVTADLTIVFELK